MSLLTTSKRNVLFEGPITQTKDFKPSCFDATLHPTASHFFPGVASCCDAERTWISGHPRLLSGDGYKQGTTVDFGGKSIKSQETMIHEASLEIKHLCDYKLNEESFGAVVCWWLEDSHCENHVKERNFSYCWWTKSCTSLIRKISHVYIHVYTYHLHYSVLSVPSGAAFLPSTVQRSSFSRDLRAQQFPVGSEIRGKHLPTWHTPSRKAVRPKICL